MSLNANWKSLTLALAALLLLAASVGATGFISYNGDFAIQYPSDWLQVDYQSADYHLSRSGADLQYEAVIADKSNIPFYSGQYFILTVDTIGSHTTAEIDTTVMAVAESFGHTLAAGTISDLATTGPGTWFDEASKVACVVSQIDGDEEAPKTSILAMKFYDRGIANFYFYAPDSMLAISLPIFQEILNSFITENLDDAIKSEPVKVADVDDENGRTLFGLPFPIAMVLIVVIAIVIRRVVARKISKKKQA